MPKRARTKHRHPTVVDIAKLAGVAPMTVSRVINGSGYVSARLREKVQSVIDKLEYHPNALARGLKSQRSHVIGILAPDIQNPYSAELAGSIQDVMLESGYTAFLSTTEQSSKREQAALAAFFDHRVAGIVVATMETEAGNEALERFTRRGLPIVLVGRPAGPPNIARVTADHWKGAYDAVEHLISLGHTRIGYIGGSPQTAGRLRRFHGYVEAMRAHGLEVIGDWIAGPEAEIGPGYSRQADGYAAMERLLGAARRPTAIFARNDFTAMGAMSAARDRGVSIPQEIAIAGFDNVPQSAFTSPPLTTVAQSTAEQGRAAARMLLDRIESRTASAQAEAGRELCLECRLIVRGSTQVNWKVLSSETSHA
jgi:DNA-binding LacI/PurR family transcriptional regulator